MTPSRRATRLYRDPVDKKIGGVASGVARYFDIDTTLMRAIWAASVLVGGFGIFLYLILWFILDEDPARLTASEGPPGVGPSPLPETEAALDETEEDVNAEMAMGDD